jgi:hypothetical protein
MTEDGRFQARSFQATTDAVRSYDLAGVLKQHGQDLEGLFLKSHS